MTKPRGRTRKRSVAPPLEENTKCLRSKSKSVDKQSKMEENVNSNHSTDGIKIQKRTKITIQQYKDKQNTKRKNQKGGVAATTSRAEELEHNKPVQDDDLEVEADDQNDTAQFYEDGELIQMEINDGGEAAKEFQNDNENDSQQSESESGNDSSAPEETEDEEADDRQSDTASDNEMDTDVEVSSDNLM